MVWTLSWWTIAVARRTDVDALELVFRGHAPLGVLGDLALDLAQLLHRLGAHLLVDLDDLELGLGDAALGLGDGCDELAALAFDAGGIALERVQARERDQVLLIEVANALQLVHDQLGFAGFRLLLSLQARDLVPGLGDALLELVLLRVPRGAACREQRPLGRHDLLNGRFIEPAGELRRHQDFGQAVTLRLEASLAAEIFIELLRHDLHVGAGHRLVQANQEIALGDAIALP